MIDIEAKLPAFALPFVLRSLRRHRGRRYVALSLSLAIVSVAVGLWLGLGTGQLERSFRIATGFELELERRQLDEFTLLAADEDEFVGSRRDAKRHQRAKLCKFNHRDAPWTAYDSLLEEGWALLRAAAMQHPRDAAEQQLQERVEALLGKCEGQEWGRPSWSLPPINLSDPGDIARIENILDAGGLPRVVRYESPLDFRALTRLIGGLATVVLGAILTIFGPLAVAMAQAQERRENTLIPLTGTTLGPRQLVLGLASGPVVIAMIYAAPQLLMFAIAVLITAKIGPAVLVLVALTGIGMFASCMGQVLAHRLGRRRMPWAIGIALLLVLSTAWLVVLAAYDKHHWWTKFGSASSLLPHLALPELLRWTFAPDATTPVGIGRALAINVVVEVGAAILAVRVLAQDLAGRSPQLRAWQAALGAGLAMLAVDAAFAFASESRGEDPATLVLGSGMLLLPFAFLLSTRVPGGDAPAKLRRVPLLRLLAELLAWVSVHVVITRTLIATTYAIEPVSLAWIAWCFITVGLLAIRTSVNAPTRLGSQLWIWVCGVFVVLALFEALESAFGPPQQITALGHLSPVLGALELALIVWIPISLIRHLRKSLGAIRA